MLQSIQRARYLLLKCLQAPTSIASCCGFGVAVRSSQPPVGPAMHAAEACSMQLLETPSSAKDDSNDAFYEALRLKYASRYVVQRCNNF